MRERERERRTGRSIDSWMDGWLERQTDCCEVRPFTAAFLPKRHELFANRRVAALSGPILLSASASIDIPNSRKKRFFEGSSTSPWKVKLAACCHHTTERGREGEYSIYALSFTFFGSVGEEHGHPSRTRPSCCCCCCLVEGRIDSVLFLHGRIKTCGLVSSLGTTSLPEPKKIRSYCSSHGRERTDKFREGKKQGDRMDQVRHRDSFDWYATAVVVVVAVVDTSS